MEFMERPPGYRGPNLDPTGVRLRPRRLAEGVYALMAFPPPRDNSGVVIGEHGALVIDAGINPAMAHQIQQTVRRLTDRPILWLANTVYHGDHTFGNAAFPTTTRIIASRQTAASMTDLDAEKRARGQNLYGNLDAIADVTSWRLPDVVFDDHTEVDLGGRTVQLWHFGPGNSPGDTVVWVPEARAAWTGNMLGHRRVAPMLLEGGPAPYLDTLARFKTTLDVRTIVPGHGPLADARALDAWMAYLRELLEAVTRARRLGLSALATVETVPLPHGHGFPRWHPAARLNRLVLDLHRLNVLATYRDLERQPTAA
jgi:cyclase